MIQPPRVDELARDGSIWTELLGQLLFDHKGRFSDALGGEVGRTEELGEHAAETPTVVQLP